MKSALILIILIATFQLIASDRTERFGKLIVECNNLENDDGVIRSHLYHSSQPDFFPKECDSAYRKAVVNPKDGRCVIIYDNIPYGEYAFTVHHDENNNVSLDRNFLGLPSEGWGISTNPKVVFSLPEFKEVKINVFKPEVRVKVKMNY